MCAFGASYMYGQDKVDEFVDPGIHAAGYRCRGTIMLAKAFRVASWLDSRVRRDRVSASKESLLAGKNQPPASNCKAVRGVSRRRTSRRCMESSERRARCRLKSISLIGNLGSGRRAQFLSGDVGIKSATLWVGTEGSAPTRSA